MKNVYSNRLLLLFLAVSFSNVFAVKTHHHTSMEDQEQWIQGFTENSVMKEELKTVMSSKIGHALLKMAELNSKLQGPIDELIESIRSFSKQLDDRIEQENADFQAIQAEYNSKKLKIQSIINQAETEMNQEKKKLFQTYLPRKDEVERTLNSLKDQKIENGNQLTMMKALRKQQNEAFLTSQTDYADSINAVDEGIKILESYLPVPGTQVSMVQLEDIEISPEKKKELTKRLKGIKGRLEATSLRKFDAFIESLSTILEKQNFEQRQYIKSLIDLLNQLRNSLVDSQNGLFEEEHNNQYQFELRLQHLQEELDVFDAKYASYFQEREEIGGEISESESIVDIYAADIISYQKRLDLESNNFAMNQKIHDELISTIQEEQCLIEKTIRVLKNPSIHDYFQTKGKLMI